MTHCDVGRLQRLLDESLPETTERDVAEHVASCPDCQTALETLAAGKNWWTEASVRLGKSALARANIASKSGDGSDEDHENANRDHGSHDHLTYGSSHDDDDHHFAADFAVDFLEPSSDPAMLGRLGEYEIVQVIGRGGMGIVLKGFQKELHRYVAVKVLAPHLATSGAARRRFAREAQATAAIVHPHVMAIHSVHANAKLPYLVMPYVACESLQERLDRQGPLDVKDVLRIGVQAALGLAAAHAQGLVHRDVKPANILLETTVDRVMLTDFGLARAVDDATLTRTGVIAGTPQYMSPEQANGDAVDHRSDLFSLGGVLYAMCTGRPPFRAETTFGVLRRIREASPRAIREINSDIPEWLERIVLRLLSKDAATRIETAEKVASLLERCLAHVQQPTTTLLPDEMDEWAPKPIRQKEHQRSQLKMWFVVAVPLTLVALVPILFVSPGSRQTPVVGDATTAEVSIPVVSELSDSVLQWDSMKVELDAATKVLEPIEVAARREFESLVAQTESSIPEERSVDGLSPEDKPPFEFMGLQDSGLKVVYVIDTSGSMASHNALQSAKDALLTSLDALNDRQQFMVIFYNDKPQVMKLQSDAEEPALVVAEAENKRLARQKISGIQPGAGTEHLPPLKLALAMKPDAIFLLTDALDPPLWPDDLKQIHMLSGGTVRIHAIEFGQGPEVPPGNSDSFLRKLASQNAGSYRYLDVTQISYLDVTQISAK